VDHAYIETESGVGMMDNGQLVIWSANQCHFRDRRQRGFYGKTNSGHRATTGGTGGKDDVTVEIHIGLLAKAARRPVRLVLDREESFLSQTKRHSIEIWTRWGATKDGKLCAMEGNVWGDKGPYAGLGPFVVKKCGLHLSGPYYIPNIRVDSYSVYTNNMFGSAMRGFGVTQAAMPTRRRWTSWRRSSESTRCASPDQCLKSLSRRRSGLSRRGGHRGDPGKIREVVLKDSPFIGTGRTWHEKGALA
jgi:CO/xanthine dehydrogenase Mo-binding subunit